MTEPVNVGFLGLGQMGGAMAERLLGKAFRLHVHDPMRSAMERFVAAGAVAHDSPKSVANAASIVFACLSSPEISLSAALGPQGVVHGSAIKVYGEMSTIGKETIEQIAVGLESQEIDTIDAPVTGGPPIARAGKLTMMVAGEPTAVEIVRPLLAMIGKEIYTLGERPGMAQVMKVVNNLIMAANMIVACEGLAMGAKAGLDAGEMLRVLKAGSGQSFSACEILRRGVDGTFDFGAALSILDKDVMLGLREANALNVEMPVIDQARQVWHSALEAGWGDQDFTTILKVVEQRNGTLVRGKTSS
ncbi:NAD(P)-dependent oxidoreductase [Noviherbaspirillum pedocola]|uniref:NAD(P)-dependent oxidoreductase n=1 Tax=Noviherbaspirillum pedocola TaxID=2801341 RepID=A0A934WA78_9BURK|nr:NAD(P)-dependent oxidoreductase [Noviherbaspirillum pedocola]MBK4739333.1 NAD(P)-dependent oxidoreductase [Noviherbaspirillum pedocola]